MSKLTAILLSLGLIIPAARGATTTEYYQINEGAYVTVGGFIGVYTINLPSARQRFLELSINYDGGDGSAVLRILGENGVTVYRSFTGGRLEGGRVHFTNSMPVPSVFGGYEMAEVDYVVQLGNASVWLDGRMDKTPRCCDIPYAFIHTGVHATILPGPPADPAGIYHYQGYDPEGSLVVTGVLAIVSRSNPITGSWHFGGVNHPQGIGPQLGIGCLLGQLEGETLSINLNPGLSDHTVFLNGRLTRESFEGAWSYSTLLGTVTNGAFTALKRRYTLSSPRMEGDRILLFCDVEFGVSYAVEYKDSLRSGRWEELLRRREDGSGSPVEDSDLSGDSRWYRLRILDATGLQMVECSQSGLARYLNVAQTSVEFLSCERREFSNTCLDCAPPDTACGEAITPGFALSFRASGQVYEVRTTGGAGAGFLCIDGIGIPLGLCE